MPAEIDQSGKIEWTQKPTVVALSNKTQFTILISAKEKRKLQVSLRSRTPKRNITKQRIRTFAILVFLLLKESPELRENVIIDVEYTGYDQQIKTHIINLFRKYDRPIDPDKISFRLIGKKSKAHQLAIETFRKRRKPDLIIVAEDILREF